MSIKTAFQETSAVFKAKSKAKYHCISDTRVNCGFKVPVLVVSLKFHWNTTFKFNFYPCRLNSLNNIRETSLSCEEQGETSAVRRLQHSSSKILISNFGYRFHGNIHQNLFFNLHHVKLQPKTTIKCDKLVSIPYGEGIISFKMTEKYTNSTFHFQGERYSLTIRWWKRWGLQM